MKLSVMDPWLLKILKSLPLLTLMYSFWLLYVGLAILHDAEENYVFFLFLTFQVYVNWAAIVCVSTNCTTAKALGLNTFDRRKEKQGIVEVNLLDYDDKNYNSIYPTGTYQNGDADQYLTKKKNNIDFDINDDFVSVSNYVNNVDIQKVWYCPKCCLNCLQNCHHCPLCSKCVFERDHHCFFLGACISRQNMKHFIVILFYTALVCLYVVTLICVEMNLYKDVSVDGSVVIRHFFPISFSKWLAGRENVHNLLRITVLNTAASIALFCLVFEVYHLYLVLSGKLFNNLQKNNRKHQPGIRKIWHNFTAIFGECGILNFMIPVGLAENVFKTHFGMSRSAFKYN